MLQYLRLDLTDLIGNRRLQGGEHRPFFGQWLREFPFVGRSMCSGALMKFQALTQRN